MNKKTVYFPGLNGIRAIAAIAVVISHITLSLKDFNLDPFIFGTFSDGKPQGLLLAGYGVSIFFVLSGFLITYLLQVEKDYKRISIKKFYIRRILRIWPLYYLYLSICLVIILVFGYDLNVKSLSLYIFYAANIPFMLDAALPFLAHYWSLGVEEQFYLFWPWINRNINSLFLFCFVSVALLFGTKIILHLFFPNSFLENAIHVTRFHCMIFGAMGAILYKRRNRLFINIADNKITQGICWLVMFLVAINKFHLASFVDTEIISVVALLLIIGQIQVRHRIVNLEINVLDFLGKISYGIYVIHPLVIFALSKLLGHAAIYTPVKYVLIYLSALVCTIGISYISYTYFEKYFLTFKKKFEVVKSSATKNADLSGLPA